MQQQQQPFLSFHSLTNMYISVCYVSLKLTHSLNIYEGESVAATKTHSFAFALARALLDLRSLSSHVCCCCLELHCLKQGLKRTEAKLSSICYIHFR